MSEYGRGAADADEDRLPWLEAVEDERGEGGVPIGRLLGALLVALLAIGLVVGGIFWLRDRPADPSGDGQLIAAPDAPYKTRPIDPGGMRVEGEGESAYAQSAGNEMSGTIDASALPEAPIVRGGVPAAGTVGTVALPASKAAAAPVASVPAPAPVAVAKAPVVEKVVPATIAAAPTAGGTIQLGAFSTEAKANAAWAALSRRFAALTPLTKTVTTVKTGAGTLYRLRVIAGGEAESVCAKMRVAGETCVVVG